MHQPAGRVGKATERDRPEHADQEFDGALRPIDNQVGRDRVVIRWFFLNGTAHRFPSSLYEPTLHIRVRRFDEPDQGRLVDFDAGTELDVTHEPAAALEQSRGVLELGAAEETDVDVGLERVDVGERGVADAGGRGAVVHQLAHVFPAPADHAEPVPRNDAQFPRMRFQPRLDCRSRSTAPSNRSTRLAGSLGSIRPRVVLVDIAAKHLFQIDAQVVHLAPEHIIARNARLRSSSSSNSSAAA